jgi:hypothetical protein
LTGVLQDPVLAGVVGVDFLTVLELFVDRLFHLIG